MKCFAYMKSGQGRNQDNHTMNISFLMYSTSHIYVNAGYLNAGSNRSAACRVNMIERGPTASLNASSTSFKSLYSTSEYDSPYPNDH